MQDPWVRYSTYPTLPRASSAEGHRFDLLLDLDPESNLIAMNSLVLEIYCDELLGPSRCQLFREEPWKLIDTSQYRFSTSFLSPLRGGSHTRIFVNFTSWIVPSAEASNSSMSLLYFSLSGFLALAYNYWKHATALTPIKWLTIEFHLLPQRSPIQRFL